MWMDYIHRNTSCGMIEGYNIISPHCPYDYCFPASTQVYVNLTKEGGADSQCAFNHLGLLCGACKPGFSVALSTSRCLQCSNNWLILLIPFCIAGIVLVISIDLTVSNGTVNAIIFFSNIIVANHPVPIPLTGYNFLVMFVSWLSLDLELKPALLPNWINIRKHGCSFSFLYIFS